MIRVNFKDFYISYNDYTPTIEDYMEYMLENDATSEEIAKIKEDGEIPSFFYELENDTAWECLMDDVGYMLKQVKESGKEYAHIDAKNIDWMHSDGYAIKDIREITPSDFLRAIIGGDYDATVRGYKATKTGFSCIVSSHDVPCGGSRLVTFLTEKQYNKISA